MSKFANKLRSLSRSATAPIGFRPGVSEARNPPLLLIAGLTGTQVKEAKIASDVNADAGVILGEGANAKTVRQVVEAVGDIPLGVFVRGVSGEEIDELLNSACDFVVSDLKGSAGILRKAEVGKFLMMEPSLDQGLVRAINSFEIDGVFISSGGDSVMAVEHLLVCRRFVEILEKPVIMTLPSVATMEELMGLWQAGVDGVVARPTQSVEALMGLKRMIGNLPRGARGRHTRTGVVLPHYGGGVVGEEDEQEEEILP